VAATRAGFSRTMVYSHELLTLSIKLPGHILRGVSPLVVAARSVKHEHAALRRRV